MKISSQWIINTGTCGHTCSGTVALLVWRCARVSRSTNIRTPFESRISFTFFYQSKASGTNMNITWLNKSWGHLRQLLTLFRMSLLRNRMSLSLSSLSVHWRFTGTVDEKDSEHRYKKLANLKKDLIFILCKKNTDPIQHAYDILGVCKRSDLLTALPIDYRKSLQTQTLHSYFGCQ